MPPRGYRKTGPTKTTIPAQVRSTTKSIKGIIREHLEGKPDTPAINETLKTQTVPKGFEPLSQIPDWAGDDVKWSVRRLQHALKLTGTEHIITSSTKLTNKQLEDLVSDYRRSMDVMGHMFPNGVAMHIPGSGDRIPRRARGWVEMSRGKHRVFKIRPALARNAKEDEHYDLAKRYREKQNTIAANRNKYTGFGGTKGQELLDPNSPSQGWTMPISEVRGNARAYTMVHEMGHILDDMNGDTGGPMAAFGGGRSGSAGVWKTLKKDLSRYGQSSAVEGYAEAAAQFFLGGKGTNSAADQYARVFGWRPAPGTQEAQR
jgi:hypothetical protein